MPRIIYPNGAIEEVDELPDNITISSQWVEHDLEEYVLPEFDLEEPDIHDTPNRLIMADDPGYRPEMFPHVYNPYNAQLDRNARAVSPDFGLWYRAREQAEPAPRLSMDLLDSMRLGMTEDVTPRQPFHFDNNGWATGGWARTDRIALSRPQETLYNTVSSTFYVPPKPTISAEEIEAYEKFLEPEEGEYDPYAVD